MNQSKGRKNSLARQIGEYLVCAELGKLGLIATPFAGNVPAFDVLAADDLCRAVPIQVKASRSDDWRTSATDWMDIRFNKETGTQEYVGARDIPNRALIYVCVAIAPQKGDQKDRFFILTKADLQAVCIKNYCTWMKPRGWRRPKTQDSYDCRYTADDLAQFKDNWQLIIGQLSCPSSIESPESTE